MRFANFHRPGAALVHSKQAASQMAADAAALSNVSALDFPRADGPTNAEVDTTAPGAGAPGSAPVGTSSTAPVASPETQTGRLPSVGVRLIGMLLALTVWSLLTAYYFNYQGVKGALESQSRDAVERSGYALQSALLLNAANLEALVRSAHEDDELASGLTRWAQDGATGPARDAARSADPAAVRGPASSLLARRTESLRTLSGADRVSVLDAQGRVLASSGHVSNAPFVLGEEALGRAWRGELWVEVIGGQSDARIRAVGPVRKNGALAVIGVLVAEFHLSRAFLRHTVNLSDVDVTVVSAHGAMAYTAPEAARRVSELPAEQWMQSQSSFRRLLAAQWPVRVQPLKVGQTPLALVMHEPQQWLAQPLMYAGQRMVLFAVLTVCASVLLGLLMTRWMIRPIQALTLRAEELSMRHAGRVVAHRGNEFDRMLNAFNAMTDALLAHSERLKKAHLNELQNSLELQRQYALMRLLRGLAMVANESESVEQALRRALEEIGEYLDWPIGRVALLPQGVHPDSCPPESFWFARDRRRFEAFIGHSEARPIVRSNNGLWVVPMRADCRIGSVICRVWWSGVGAMWRWLRVSNRV